MDRGAGSKRQTMDTAELQLEFFSTFCSTKMINYVSIYNSSE